MFDQKRAYAIARELGASIAECNAYLTLKTGRTSAGKAHTPHTVASVTGVPEARIGEIEHAVAQRVERDNGAAFAADY